MTQQLDIPISMPVLVSYNRFLFITAIYSLPDHIAPSVKDVLDRCIEIGKLNGWQLSRGNLIKSLLKNNSLFIIISRLGIRKKLSLTQLSIDILEGRVPYRMGGRKISSYEYMIGLQGIRLISEDEFKNLKIPTHERA